MPSRSEKDWTFKGQRPPLPVHCLERIGTRLLRWGIPLAPLSESAVLAAAQRRTGLTDFGDEAFREPLGVLLQAFAEEPRLNFLGRLIIRNTCLEGAVNRLKTTDVLRRHPEILETPITRPLLVVGMPRTGTTLLHNLLSKDPRSFAPPLWQLNSPAPPEPPMAPEHDPRRIAALRMIDRYYRFVPNAALVHPMNADWPEECHHLFRNTFATRTFFTFGDIPRYAAWCRESDFGAAYRDYLRQLKMLKWGRDEEYLVLKNPGHTWCLDSLLDAIPDACIVHLHRDPAKTLGSFCSGTAMTRYIVQTRVDLRDIGRFGLENLTDCVHRAMQVRETADPARFCDIAYDELVADPVAIVRRIYDHFDRPFTAGHQQQVAAWVADHPQHKHGRHRYDLAQFGVDSGAVRDAFRKYWERFGNQPVSAA